MERRKRPLELESNEEMQAAPLVSIRKSDIPDYLQKGEFFQSLDEGEEDEQILVPNNTLKNDASVNSCEDLEHLLSSLRFWGVDELIRELINNVMERKNWLQYKNILDNYEQFFPRLKAVREHHFHPEKKTVLFSAAHFGDLDLLKHLHETKQTIHNRAAEAAAEQGHFDCLKYLVEQGCECTHRTLTAAMEGGDVECLKYVWDRVKTKTSRHDYQWHVRIHDHNIDSFLYANHHLQPELMCTVDWQASAMLYNGTESIDYGVKHGLPLHSRLYYLAAASGRTKLKVFQHLHAVGCPWPANTRFCKYLCWRPKGGFVEFLRFAHEHGCPWDARDVIETAARCGEVQCLQYAHEQGCPWDAHVGAAAAAASSLRCLKYVHKHNCPWNADVCVAAARNYQNLKYLHENGCPWDARAYAAGSVRCKEYMREHDCPGSMVL